MNVRIFGLAWLAVMIVVPSLAIAQQTATVTIPPGVSFSVLDVSVSTSGTPNPVQLAYSVPKTFPSNQALIISVKAETSNFGGPGTVHPAASSVSWTGTATTGTVSAGTLSGTVFTQLYRKNNPAAGSSSGTIDLHWLLAPIAAPRLRAGSHTLTLRWKIEAF